MPNPIIRVDRVTKEFRLGQLSFELIQLIVEQPDFLPVADPEGIQCRARACDVGIPFRELPLQLGYVRSQGVDVVAVTRAGRNERTHPSIITNGL